MVDGTAITVESYRRAWQAVARQGQMAADDATVQDLKQSVLDQLIERQLLLAAAQKAHIDVTDAEVDAAITDMRRGYANDADFTAVLYSQGITPDELKTRRREDLLIRKLISSEVHERVAVIDSEVLHAYEESRTRWQTPEHVRARLIVVKTEDDARAAQRRLMRGERFEDVAREVSVSPEAPNGGLLPAVERGMLPAKIEEACFTYREGSTSPIIESDHGFVMVRVEKKHPARALSFAEAAPRIEARLLGAKQRESEKQFKAGLRAGATIEISPGWPALTGE